MSWLDSSRFMLQPSEEQRFTLTSNVVMMTFIGSLADLRTEKPAPGDGWNVLGDAGFVVEVDIFPNADRPDVGTGRVTVAKEGAITLEWGQTSRQLKVLDCPRYSSLTLLEKEYVYKVSAAWDEDIGNDLQREADLLIRAGVQTRPGGTPFCRRTVSSGTSAVTATARSLYVLENPPMHFLVEKGQYFVRYPDQGTISGGQLRIISEWHLFQETECPKILWSSPNGQQLI